MRFTERTSLLQAKKSAYTNFLLKLITQNIHNQLSILYLRDQNLLENLQFVSTKPLDP